MTISGVCDLEHLGRTTMFASQTVNFAEGSITNSTRYTAANGDVLLSTFNGHLAAPAAGFDLGFAGAETYTGGTGRFAGATGSSALEGSAKFTGPATAIGEYTTKGSLSY